MPAFMSALPTWAWIVIAIVALYGAYKYWQYRKASAYAPNIIHGADIVLTTPRDNPPGNGK